MITNKINMSHKDLLNIYDKNILRLKTQKLFI